MRALLLCFLMGIPAGLRAAPPDSTLARLIDERTRLYRDWDYFQRQNHALFGGKSKSDLRNIIATLEGIVAKDNQVFDRLRSNSEREKARLETKTGDLTNQTNDFLGQSNELTVRLQKLESRLTAERVLRREAENRAERSFQLAGGIVLVGLALAWWLRRRARG